MRKVAIFCPSPEVTADSLQMRAGSGYEVACKSEPSFESQQSSVVIAWREKGVGSRIKGERIKHSPTDIQVFAIRRVIFYCFRCLVSEIECYEL